MVRFRPNCLKWAAVALALSATGADAKCRLALALALDISSSVDSGEYYIQQEGLATALENDAVRDAFLPGNQDPVALAIYEWSSAQQQTLMLNWVLVRDAATLDAIAATLRAHPRTTDTSATAIGNALIYGHSLLNAAPPCDRQTIDLSGDGINNDGSQPHRAYGSRNWSGITVNALAIGRGAQMETYYRRYVTRGINSFVERAERFDDFPVAMERKLIRELMPDMLLGQMLDPRQSRSE